MPFPQANLPGHDIVWTIQGVEQARLTTGAFFASTYGSGVITAPSILSLAGDINIPYGGVYQIGRAHV